MISPEDWLRANSRAGEQEHLQTAKRAKRAGAQLLKSNLVIAESRTIQLMPVLLSLRPKERRTMRKTTPHSAIMAIEPES